MPIKRTECKTERDMRSSMIVLEYDSPASGSHPESSELFTKGRNNGIKIIYKCGNSNIDVQEHNELLLMKCELDVRQQFRAEWNLHRQLLLILPLSVSCRTSYKCNCWALNSAHCASSVTKCFPLDCSRSVPRETQPFLPGANNTLLVALGAGARCLDLRGRNKQEIGENYTMRSFRGIALGQSNKKMRWVGHVARKSRTQAHTEMEK